MDYVEKNENFTTESLPDVSSPEMFDSDTEHDTDTKHVIASINEDTLISPNPQKPLPAELITKSDGFLLARINKFLSGVPPPPKHTICQSDCSDFLMRIYQNYQYFWTKYPSPDKRINSDQELLVANKKSPDQIKFENIHRTHLYQRTKTTPRNLTNAFDACDLVSDTSSKKTFEESVDNDSNNLKTNQNISDVTKDTVIVTKSTVRISSALNSTRALANTSGTRGKQLLSKVPEAQSLLHTTIEEKTATTLTWPEAFYHKYHGIHYNRNRAVEDFENLTIKLYERYVGAETQTTCNIFFSKQAPGSARKRSLLSKRDNGQSPGKRLNHLTRRRRTFSSANLQRLGLPDRKLLILNTKKPASKKGKSPRYKSPRGKSPRGSTKKKAVRRLLLEGPSPHKLKLETSKRALFQSPPSDRAGPSKLLSATNTNPETIKRTLFPTPTKTEDEQVDGLKNITIGENRKRKCEDESEGPRFKWAKSLSFDCPHELQNRSLSSWEPERYSSGNTLLNRETSFSQRRSELSDTHRKKLLWAVAEALRSKGIGMDHPQFKQYASNLARTVKKFMPDLENKNIPRKPGSTSDRMLKLAKHHVLFMIDTKSGER